MNKEHITLTRTELTRLDIVQRSLSGGLTVASAAELLQISERQLYRLRAKVKALGPTGIAHGNRGRPSPRKLPEDTKHMILDLHKTTFSGFNDTHFTYVLAQEHHLKLSRETVRQILRAHGIPPKRPRRPPKYRSRRPRKEHAGDMIQLDGSHHDWLSGRGPKLCLLLAVDDATNYPWARFEMAETTDGYFRLLKTILIDRGAFSSVYTDKHSIFRIEHGRQPTLQEQLQGDMPQTQLQRALRDLGISIIYAHSPQAKGRVERLHQFFQDRLLAELDRAKASTLHQANKILKKVLAYYRRHFALKAPSAFRPLPKNIDLDLYLCHKYTRTVAADNSFSYNNRLYQLPPTTDRISWTKAKIEVHHLPNGTIRAVYQGKIIKAFKPSEGVIPLHTLRKLQAKNVSMTRILTPETTPALPSAASP